MDKNKKIILKISGVFVGILIFLTFFSNTIYNFNLPSVTLGFPAQEVIAHTADGRGIVDFAERDLYYAEKSGRVTLFVNEGEFVSEEELLFTISADIDELRQTLNQLLFDKERIDFRIEMVNSDIENIERNVDRASGDQRRQLQRLVSDLRVQLEDLMYWAPHSEREIERLNQQISRAQADLNRATGNQRLDLERTMAELEFQIRELEFEAELKNREIENVRKQIAAGGVSSVYAQESGVVQRINFNSGMLVFQNDVVMALGNFGAGFKSVVGLPGSVDFITIGNVFPINIPSRDLTNINARVSNTFFDGGSLMVEVRFEAEDVFGGEMLELRASRASGLFREVIPNTALRADMSGYFVLYIEVIEGLLRNEYIARRLNVEVLDYNNFSTAIGTDRIERLSIIINSDRVVNAGDRVRIVGELNQVR